jgi:DNA-binding response OmpR family regulator
MTKILIVEDDKDIALGLEEDLTHHGFQVETVGDGEKAIHRSKECGWDLIILDIMLPRKDGFEVCQELRRAGIKTPIIMLTAKTHEAEKIFGLEIGADDYITKPFSPRELRARIHAVLRRVSESSLGTCNFGDCEVDFDRGEVRRGGQPINLTALEFRLLTALPVPEKPCYICSVRGMGYRFEG